MKNAFLRGAAWLIVAELIPSLGLLLVGTIECNITYAWDCLVLIWMFGSPFFIGLGAIAFVLGFITKDGSPVVSRKVGAALFLLLLLLAGADFVRGGVHKHTAQSCVFRPDF